MLTHEFEIRKSSVEMERNMTLSECYEEMGADLHEVLRRLKTEEDREIFKTDSDGYEL